MFSVDAKSSKEGGKVQELFEALIQNHRWGCMFYALMVYQQWEYV